MSQGKVHIMVDIETFDVKPTATILSLGACTVPGAQLTFYRECSHVQPGRTVSGSTLEWWANQNTPVPESTQSLESVLQEFVDWINSLGQEPIIWCKGTDFDVAILAHALDQCNIPVPWKYNNVRDMRTVKKLHPQLHYSENFQPHHALQDALCQARDLSQIFAYNQYLQWG